MKKNVIAIAMCAAVMASVSACGNSNTAQTTAATTVAAETTTAPAAETTATETTAAPAAETTMAEESQSEKGEDEVSEAEGILMDASMNFCMIQDKDGNILMFSNPEDGDPKKNLKDGLILGRTIKVTYTGDPEKGTAVVSEFADSDMETALDADAYLDIIEINETIKLQDMEGLAGYMSFPCYVHTENFDDTVADKAAFMELPREDVFNDALLQLVDFNLFKIEETDAGIVVGDGKPNYILSKDDTGSYMITGINAVQ